jgi:hypothetical protein
VEALAENDRIRIAIENYATGTVKIRRTGLRSFV